MYDTLKGYVYKFLDQGGRNPRAVINFVKYVHNENKTFEELPGSVSEYLDTQDYAKSTKRNLTTTLNNFVKLVYRYEGLFMPGTITTKSIEDEEDEVDVQKFNPHGKSQKKLEDLRAKMSESDEKVESEVLDEEYKAFLEKYERITGSNV